jgi:asparagine synthase (glutamine-hydrolysing)
MSALAGIVRFDGGPPDVTTVARMIDCVEHRGRDRRDVRAGGAIALAYRWQRTGPARSVDEQPLFDPVARTALVFDGRLDNRPDLSNDLDLRDDDAVPDAAFVMAAHRRWGRDMLPRLLGDFALALWDARERCLILARDPRGIRSLSYAVVGDSVAFATEPRQLLRVSGVNAGPNLGFLGERLSSQVSHPTDTIFLGIQRVPAAHVATATFASTVRVNLARHWDIDVHREVRYADDAQYAEHFADLYGRALTARLRGLDRVAVLLSGGLDSSSIVGMVSRVAPGHRPVEVRAYNHAFRDFPESDEEQDAAHVAQHCRVPFTPIPFEGASLEHHLENARRLEDTIPGTLGRSDDALAARMTNDGCPVVLTGIGGDEWFTGAYLHSADLFRTGRVAAGLRQLWADGHHPDAFHGVGVLARSCVWAMTPGPVRRVVKRVLPRRDLVPAGFNRIYAAEVSLVDRITPRPADTAFPTLAGGAIYAAAMHPDGIYCWDESARQASLYGNELSAPLLDRRLAEFAMALPEEQRWSGRATKRVLRAAMAGILPDDVRMRRRKADPSAVLFAEIRRMHDQGAFRRMELVEAGVLDGEAVGALYEELVRLFAARQDRYKVLAYRLWTLFAGECVWRTLFGRRARTLVTHSGRDVFSGRETPRAGFG